MCISFLPLPILPRYVPPNHSSDQDVQTEITQSNAVTDSIRRRVIASVELCANDSAEVPNRDLQSACGRPLRSAGHIHGRPAEGERSGWVDAGGAEEHAEVTDAGVVVMWSMDSLAFDGGRDDVVFVVGKEYDVADDGDCAGGDCEGCADPRFGGDPRDCDGDDGCKGVWGDGEELSLVGAVAEGDDDCWLGC